LSGVAGCARLFLTSGTEKAGASGHA